MAYPADKYTSVMYSANITSCFVQGDVKLVCCWELHSLGKHLFCSTCPINNEKILGCHLTQNTQSLEIDSVVSEKSWWGNLAMVICWVSRVDGQTLDCWRWLWGVNVRPRLILVHFLLKVQNQLKIGQSLVNFLTSDLVSHLWSSKKWIEDSYLEELLQ